MAKYLNRRTGAIIEATYPVRGGEWEPVQDPTVPAAATIDAPAGAPAAVSTAAGTAEKTAAPAKKTPAKKAPAKKPASKSAKKR